MLKTKGMTGIELKNAAMECRSTIISPKLVPVMLVKLQEEGLIQQAGNSMYVITTKGLESLKSLDSMNKEFQKIAKIMQRTSSISKLMVNEAFDWIAGVKDDIVQKYADNSQEANVGVPLYGADKNQAKSTYNFEGGSEF
jgi:DNA-binding PadR family transcriptional regulator